MKWFIYATKKYANFSGRARRKEYWYFVLFYALIAISLRVIDVVAGTYSARFHQGLLGGLFSVAFLLPSLAVAVRRLHDIGRSGAWLWTFAIPPILLLFTPLVGVISIMVLWASFVVLALIAGDAGRNAYGPPPQEV